MKDTDRFGALAVTELRQSRSTMRSLCVVLLTSASLVLFGASHPAAMAAVASTPADGSLPSIAEMTKGLERRDGLLSMYFDSNANKVWLEIPNTGRDLLYEVSLPSGLGSTDIGLDRGQIDGGRIVRFERYGPKVLLVQPNQSFRGDTPDPAERDVVETSFASSVLYGFPVVAKSADAVLIDATDFALNDPFDASGSLKNAKQGEYRADPLRSAIVPDYTKSFPDNTEITSLVTLTTAGDPQSTVSSIVPTPQSVTISERQSFVALPGPGFVPRRSDPRAGFFTTGYDDFATPFDQPLQQRLINRWRLIKRDPHAAIDEPVKPIVYYVERGVPEPIRTAIMTGASWWSSAFESAGFKNAFRVELLPEGADPMDVRYNIIQWVHRATRGYSIGNSVVDPRTGEILKANVTIGSLRDRQDYLIGEGLLSPYVRGDEAPAELRAVALARIRQVAAHEVGHTLGLEHNFIINDDGRTSVMGYPQPLARLSANGTIDLSHPYREGIGPWDRVAIAWGYSEFPPGTDEPTRLAQILATAQQHGLTLLTDQDADGNAEPDAHRWNNGTNAVSELNRMMQIRRVALARLGEQTIRRHQPLATIEEALVPIYLYHRYQSFAAAASIGGEKYRYALRGEDSQPALAPVAGAEQRRALAAILATVRPSALALPRKLLRLLPPRPADYGATPELFARATGIVFDALSPATTAAEMTFANIFAPDRCARLVVQHAVDPALPGLSEVLATTGNIVFAQPAGDGYEREIARTVQRSFVASVVELAGSSPSGQVRAESSSYLHELRERLHADRSSDNAQRSDAQWLGDQIERFLKRPYGASDTVPPLAVPNGAPI